jgi:hypothetical protein
MTMGGGRVTDPNHPLLGGQTRAAAHLNPRDPNNPSSIFGLTMQPVPVNRKLGRTPQIMMTERLPDVEGLTSVGGISTGVVAGEHARYSALMATLGVQSRQEIEQLKKTIAMGGQVSKEFIDTFDDILPITQRLTQNAAAQSSAIVAQLRAGKLNVEQARAAIIAVNADLERMMGAEVTAYAASRGRTIDLTKAPLIDQPVVDPRGKPNVRGMFRQGIFGRVMSAVGRATRTRTIGGPYSIETTKPQGLNAGGSVVPGPNINADVVPAMLTPGEFVVNREATAANLPLLMAINNRTSSTGPGFNDGGFMPARMLWQSAATNMILAHPSQTRRRASLGLGPGDRIPGQVFAQDFMSLYSQGVHPAGLLYEIGTRLGYSPKDMQMSLNQMNDDIVSSLSRAGDITPADYDRIVSNSMEKHLSKIQRGSASLGRRVSMAEEIQQLGFSRNISNRGIAPGSLRQRGFDGQIVPQPFISTGGGMPAGMAQSHWSRMQELFPESKRRPSPQFGTGRTMTSMFGAQRGHVGASLAARILSRGRLRMNRGGMVPGYQRGGLIAQMALGTLGYMGGSALGGAIAGQGGSIAGGMLGSFAPMLMGSRAGGTDISRLYEKSIISGTSFGQSMAGQAMQGNKLTSTLARLALGLTKTNIAVGAAG